MPPQSNERAIGAFANTTGRKTASACLIRLLIRIVNSMRSLVSAFGMCKVAFTWGMLTAVCNAGAITVVDEFRFIRADAVIDVNGDGTAEIWDIDTASPPSEWAAWSGSVLASAAYSIDGVGSAIVSAAASQMSSFMLSGDQVNVQASGFVSSSVLLSGMAQDHGTFGGFPRLSGGFSNYWFDFDLDETFSYDVEGSFSSHWILQDRDSFAWIASFLDGSSAAGLIGPGRYRLGSTVDATWNSGATEFDFALSLRPAGAVPEPTGFALLGSGALVLVGCRRRRSSRATALA